VSSQQGRESEAECIRFLARRLRALVPQRQPLLFCAINALEGPAVVTGVLSKALSWLQDSELGHDVERERRRKQLWRQAVALCPVASRAAKAGAEVKAAGDPKAMRRAAGLASSGKACPNRAYFAHVGIPVAAASALEFQRDRDMAASSPFDLEHKICFYPPLEEWSPETHRNFPLSFRRRVVRAAAAHRSSRVGLCLVVCCPWRLQELRVRHDSRCARSSSCSRRQGAAAAAAEAVLSRVRLVAFVDAAGAPNLAHG
jgi:hypothetical protein